MSRRFNIVSSYLEQLNVTHHNLPSSLINMEAVNIIQNAPEISVQLSTNSSGSPDIHQTFMHVDINSTLIFFDNLTNEEKTLPIYTINLKYSVYTHINNTSEISIKNIEEILLVDVPTLVFPDVKYLVRFLTTEMMSTPVVMSQIDWARMYINRST